MEKIKLKKFMTNEQSLLSNNSTPFATSLVPNGDSIRISLKTNKRKISLYLLLVMVIFFFGFHITSTVCDYKLGGLAKKLSFGQNDKQKFEILNREGNSTCMLFKRLTGDVKSMIYELIRINSEESGSEENKKFKKVFQNFSSDGVYKQVYFLDLRKVKGNRHNRTRQGRANKTLHR